MTLQSNPEKLGKHYAKMAFKFESDGLDLSAVRDSGYPPPEFSAGSTHLKLMVKQRSDRYLEFLCNSLSFVPAHLLNRTDMENVSSIVIKLGVDEGTNPKSLKLAIVRSL